MINKIMKKTIPIVICLALVFGITVPLNANIAPSEKEEVVYVNLNSDGTIDGIYVVNILDNINGDIIDYGNYTSIRNMTTTDQLKYSGDLVSGTTSSKKIYYQGTLTASELPWNISIKYFLDGTEYSSQEIAGKSGQLEIRISITKNENCKSSFFEKFALQATVTLDTNLCSNITAEGATIANVGNNKQFTYTILPNTGKEISITADVCDFRMDSIAINGIKMALDIEIENQELLDKINELINGITQLDDGANNVKLGTLTLYNSAKYDLLDGINELEDGSNELVNGAKYIKDGSLGLKNGAAAVNNGMDSLESGLNALDQGVKSIEMGFNEINLTIPDLSSEMEQVEIAFLQVKDSLSKASDLFKQIGELSVVSSKIKTGIDELCLGIKTVQDSINYNQYKKAMNINGLDIDVLKQGNREAISTLKEQVQELNKSLKQIENISGMETQVTLLKDQIKQLEGLVTLLEGNNAAISGTEIYFNQVSSVLNEISAGALTLKENYDVFDTALNGLINTLSDLLANVSNLCNSINGMIKKIIDSNITVDDIVNNLASLISGYNELTTGIETLAKGSKVLKSGTNELYNGTVDLYNGLSEYSNGVNTFSEGTNGLNNGVLDLIDGISKLYSGTNELKNGTGELKDQTSNMDTKVTDEIDNILSSFTGSNNEIQSFVSERNINTNAVQFVIKTPGIEIEDTALVLSEVEEPLNFWQKLLKLFGLYK